MINQTDKLNKQAEVEKNVLAQLKDITKKYSKLENTSKEMSDNIVMLESTLNNREKEIETLKNYLSKAASKPDTHNCDECDFTSESNDNLKIHTRSKHEHLCSFCNSTFEGIQRVKNHTCRIKIENPTSWWFYTKDWYERGKCVRVFDNQLKEEVVVVHSEECVDKRSCPELPANFNIQKYFKDTQSILHLRSLDYMISNKIKWENIWGMKSMIIDQGFDPTK